MSRFSKLALAAIGASAMGLMATSAPVKAQAGEMYVGEIFSTASGFCPREAAQLDGQLLAIAENEALFSLIGTIYGGDGRTTFALPDMRGRVPMHNGSGPGLTPRQIGERFGAESTTMGVNNMPAHSHNPRMRVPRVNGTRRNPIDSYMARSPSDDYDLGTSPDFFMAADAIQSQTVGSQIPFNNIQPILVNRYCIVLFGIYPSRS